VKLLEPLWLLLAIPLLTVLWRFPLSSRLQNILRSAAILLSLLAVAGLSLRLPSRAGTVVVVADRSLSMPDGSAASQKEAIDLLHGAMGPKDRLAVVSFGETAAVEHAPEQGKFAGFTHEVGGDASNLADALDTALALVPKNAPGRILVLSDGQWTGRDPAGLSAVAASRSVAIDYRHQSRSAAGDLAMARVDAPASVAAGEGFLITAWAQSPIEQTVKFELTRGDQVISSGEKQLVSGLNRLTFRDRAGEPGTLGYRIRLTGSAEDPFPENNVARVLVGVTGPRPILHLTPGPESSLTALLRRGGLDVRAMAPEKFGFSLEELSGYSAVLLENVAADRVTTRGMETLAGWVRVSGSGLMITGGKQSYGPGGYYKSPLEPILPVSMELRQEHRKLAVAIVVTLDRSGSMAVPVPGGKVKMDLANLGTVQVLDMLGPLDEFGCFAVDTVAHTIAELGPVKDKDALRDKILRIESMGGGIYVYEALAAAADMIKDAKSGTKHIVLFADAADAEEPGRSKELLAMTSKAGITVSVIGLGTRKDKDADLLEDLARRGGGRFFITDKPDELPRLFAQDTFIVSRSSFLDEPVKLQPTIGLSSLLGRAFALDRSIGGYNLCYIRPEATLGVVTQDEYQAPAVASWQAGAGRVLCYTGEADGKYAGAFAKSAEAGEFYASLARWTAGQKSGLSDGMALTQEVRNGVNRVQLHLDPDRKTEPFVGTPTVATLRARGGQPPREESVPLLWTGPDTLTVEIPLRGDETTLSTVSVHGQNVQALTPVCLPYSPEYAPATQGTEDSNRGRALLDHLAGATGGTERIELTDVWKDLPVRPRTTKLASWLLLAAAILLLLEVFERRTGQLRSIGRAVWVGPRRLIAFLRRRVRTSRETKPAPAQGTPAAEPTTPMAPGPPQPKLEPSPEAPPTPEPEPSAPKAKGDVLDAMRQARSRSRGRTDR
jgi:Mg-chelatase subunit ChlD